MSGEKKIMTPEQCLLHQEMLVELTQTVADIKVTVDAAHKSSSKVELAVCGDDRLGVSGLVKEVAELKEWKRKIDLRVAAISGGAFVVLTVAKELFSRS